MAEKQKSNVGVVLVNSLGLYKSDMFAPLNKLQLSNKVNSFLVANSHYFYGGNDQVTPPEYPFPENYRPPEFGKPLFLISEGAVPKETAKMYLDTYSLEGPFGRIAKLGYLCTPDIELVCQYITSPNPLLQKRACMMMARDQVVIDLVNLALDVSEDVHDIKLQRSVIQRTFLAIDTLKYIPLERGIEVAKDLYDRDLRLSASGGSEQKYAQIARSIPEAIISEARQCQAAPQSQTRQ